MARASDFTAPLDDAPDRAAKRIEDKRTLVIAGINHALHDGYTDLIYVLLPVWQAEFGLDWRSKANKQPPHT